MSKILARTDFEKDALWFQALALKRTGWTNMDVVEAFLRAHSYIYESKPTNTSLYKEFKSAAISFFANIKQYDKELKTLLTDSFQILPA